MAGSVPGSTRARVSARVVIVGAGFGGLECARRLNRAAVDVLLLDRGGYHLFTPLLYQVTTALLNPAAHQARRDAYPTGRTRTRR